MHNNKSIITYVSYGVGVYAASDIDDMGGATRTVGLLLSASNESALLAQAAEACQLTHKHPIAVVAAQFVALSAWRVPTPANLDYLSVCVCACVRVCVCVSVSVSVSVRVSLCVPLSLPPSSLPPFSLCVSLCVSLSVSLCVYG